MTTPIAGDGLAGLTVRTRTPVSGRARAAELPPGLQKYLQTAEASLAEPFKGVTTDGHVVPGLFQLSRSHIHTVVRTPNGNDYGRDLLRQHHERFDHSRADHQHH